MNVKLHDCCVRVLLTLFRKQKHDNTYYVNFVDEIKIN